MVVVCGLTIRICSEQCITRICYCANIIEYTYALNVITYYTLRLCGIANLFLYVVFF
jgi:hypothetical protein